MVSLLVFMAEARLAAHETIGKARSHGRSPPRGAKGEIDEASALNGVHRSIVRFVERQVVGVFRIGSASQNKGLINRRN